VNLIDESRTVNVTVLQNSSTFYQESVTLAPSEAKVLIESGFQDNSTYTIRVSRNSTVLAGRQVTVRQPYWDSFNEGSIKISSNDDVEIDVHHVSTPDKPPCAQK
jgi:dissimilatory sulfite reductase (desulfoviridin) alpha/beta subunit